MHLETGILFLSYFPGLKVQAPPPRGLFDLESHACLNFAIPSQESSRREGSCNSMPGPAIRKRNQVAGPVMLGQPSEEPGMRSQVNIIKKNNEELDLRSLFTGCHILNGWWRNSFHFPYSLQCLHCSILVFFFLFYNTILNSEYNEENIDVLS